MLSTKTKERIRRRAALVLPRWATLLIALGALGAAVVFTGGRMRVVTITDTHGAKGYAITAAQDLDTLFAQTGVAQPGANDVLQITEEDGHDQYQVLRAYTVEVTADGETRGIVTTGGTVAEVLTQGGISIGADDEVAPAADTATTPGMAVTLRRVTYREYQAEEVIPVETEYAYSSLFYRNKDYTDTVLTGTEGLDAVTYRETYVDGVLTDTSEIARETMVEMTPTYLKCYGEGIPVSSFVGPEVADGAPVEGVAAVYTGQRATGYSASATARGSSGRRLTYGTVAINPGVIPYGSLLYITSDDGRFVYGYAYAADTGTAMMTGHAFIDLYYETYDESVANAVISCTVYVLDSDTAAAYKEQNDALLAADTTPGI